MTPTVDGARIEVDANADWSPQLSRLALDAGIVLRELRPIEANLETTFLDLTSNHHPRPAATPAASDERSSS